MSRITRKELKTDKFALEVEHGHLVLRRAQERSRQVRRQLPSAVIVLIIGYTIYSRSQHSDREQALAAAIQVQEAPVGQSGNGGLAFPTQEAKDQESIRVFTDLQTKYSGSAEGEIAQYYLGSIKADQGKLAEAEKLFQEVAQKGDEKYASLAKLVAGADLLRRRPRGPGRKDPARPDRQPTVFVSSDQATISLARYLGAEEARRGAQAAGSAAHAARAASGRWRSRCWAKCRRSSRRVLHAGAAAISGGAKPGAAISRTRASLP